MKRKKPVAITKEREYELIRRAKDGDKAAKAELLEAHKPFIMTVIKEFTLPGWVSLEDVQQEGQIGMLDAIERFDLSRNLRLCTFAYWRIKKAVVAYLSEMGYPMKVPFPDVVKLKKTANRIEMGLSQDLEEDHKFLNQSKNIHILHLILGCLPINPTEYGQGRDEDSAWSAIESQLSTMDPSDRVIGSILVEEIISKLTELTVYEGHMLAQYLGIYVTEDPVPLKYIAGERSRVVKINEDSVDIVPGWNGFGLQIGETYNSVGKLIKQSEAKLKAILRRFLGRPYADYLES